MMQNSIIAKDSKGRAVRKVLRYFSVKNKSIEERRKGKTGLMKTQLLLRACHGHGTICDTHGVLYH